MPDTPPEDPPPFEPNLVIVADLEELQDGTLITVSVDGHRLVVGRQAQRIFACEALCPHEKGELSRGRLSQGRLVCPRHLSSFDIQTGEASAGWKLDRLKLYPVRVEDGRIAIDRKAVARDPPGGPRKLWDLTAQR